MSFVQFLLKQISSCASSNLVPLEFTSGSQWSVEQPLIHKKITSGGIQMGVITEIYGESNSGKAQLCHTLCHIPRSGISTVDVKKLKDSGFCTVESVTYLPRNDLKNLSLMKGIKKAVINKITEAASKLVPLEFTSGSQWSVEQPLIHKKITSGSREIDRILRGGIQMGVITEIYGESNSGKTQLCHTLCVTFQGSGISAADVKKLKDVGFCTGESVTYLPRNDLKNLLLKKGIKKAVINKITEAGMSL
ncbi:hypothetical protein EJ110_NYTH11624 [Nymphaea thermarum]|nr:hypothetical protein EJ110_NYTH11624 [Nymphaea thermarum]